MNCKNVGSYVISKIKIFICVWIVAIVFVLSACTGISDRSLQNTQVATFELTETKSALPEITTIPSEIITVSPETTVRPTEITTVLPETTVRPAETTVLPETTVRSAETIVPPETTARPIEVTTVLPETTVRPAETTTVLPETTFHPVETTLGPSEISSENPETTYVSGGIIQLRLTSKASINNDATLEILGKPNTKYRINVYYKTKPSQAKGLVEKESDENGYVSWTWRVGASVQPGSYRIQVVGGGETFVTYLNVG